MKKLMTMIGAAAMAFGLFAADPDGFKSGTGFETARLGDTDEIFAAGVTTVAGSAFWAGNTDKATITAGTYVYDSAKYGVPAPFGKDDSTQFLKIATALNTEEITRKVGDQQGAALDIEKSIYFDSLVNFTVFDYNDTVTVPDDAKLGVYLMLNEVETETNLYVYANGGDGVKAYKSDSTIAEGWHRLTIKAIGNVYKTGSAVGFVVFVDQNPVSCSGAGLDDASNLTLYANGLNVNNELFLSLIGSGTEGFKTIKSVSYSGQGEVDNLVFGDVAPFDNAKDVDSYTADWSAVKSMITALTINGEDYTAQISNGSADIALPDGGTVVIAWTGTGDYIDGSKTVTGITKQGDTASLTVTDVLPAAASVDGLKLNLLSDAVATANVATAVCELKLLANATEAMAFNNMTAAITIDLNGWKALGISAAAKTAVVINDQSTGATGVVDGAVSKNGMGSSITANAGKFLVSENLNIETTVTKAAGKKWVRVDNDQYWQLVDKIALMSISLKAATKLAPTATEKLEYTLNPSNADVDLTTTVWASDDTKVATVADDGTVTAVAAGTANITVTIDGVTSSACVVTVEASEITITVTLGDGIMSATIDDKTVTSGAEIKLAADKKSVTYTLTAADGIKIPVFYKTTGDALTEKISKMGLLAVSDKFAVTFSAKDASGEDVTDADAAAALKDKGINDATLAKFSGTAKKLAGWMETKGESLTPAQINDSDFVQASVALDVALITESTEVALESVDLTDTAATTFKVKVGTDDVSAKEAVLSMVKAGTDVEFKETFEPQAQYDQETSTVKVNISGKDAAFLKVVIPTDK